MLEFCTVTVKQVCCESCILLFKGVVAATVNAVKRRVFQISNRTKRLTITTSLQAMVTVADMQTISPLVLKTGLPAIDRCVGNFTHHLLHSNTGMITQTHTLKTTSSESAYSDETIIKVVLLKRRSDGQLEMFIAQERSFLRLQTCQVLVVDTSIVLVNNIFREQTIAVAFMVRQGPDTFTTPDVEMSFLNDVVNHDGIF